MDFFDKARQAIFDDALSKSDFKEYDAEKLTLCPGSVPPLENVFDALDIKNRCCRMRMLSVMPMDKLYK
jgi:DNA-directed RNA polymerase subunit N (RpoN/RPB10)